jgi:uncharacterized membrane protein YdjX (TVP38/TMEM64 family)
MKISNLLRWVLAVLLIVAFVRSVVHYIVPLRHYVHSFLNVIQGLGYFEPVAIVIVNAIVCIVFLPGSAVTLFAGFRYGILGGTVIASIGATLGAAGAFVIGRFLIREWVERRMASHPAFIAIDRAIGSEGFKIVLLCRLCSLIPFDLTSYASGVSKISFRQYILATWLGRLPETLLFAYLGSSAKDLNDLWNEKPNMSPAHEAFLAFGLLVMVVVMILIARIARKALLEAVKPGK